MKHSRKKKQHTRPEAQEAPSSVPPAQEASRARPGQGGGEAAAASGPGEASAVATEERPPTPEELTKQVGELEAELESLHRELHRTRRIVVGLRRQVSELQAIVAAAEEVSLDRQLAAAQAAARRNGGEVEG